MSEEVVKLLVEDLLTARHQTRHQGIKVNL